MNKINMKITEGIAYIGIERPEALNALSREIIDRLDELIDEIGENKDVRVLIIHSNKNFAAGADISGMVECNPESARKFGFTDTYNKIEALKIPTIAVIEGYALGGGLELALACDLRIAVTTAKLGFPEISLGIMPGAGGTVRAPKLIGIAKAKELIMLGGTIDAEEAKSIGLVNAVVNENAPLELAIKWANKFKELSAIALKTTKETINATAEEPSVLKGTEIELNNWCKMFTTEDQKEGMRAFLEKRKPEFKGN